MANRHIVDRHLPERTKLMFYFPVPTRGSDSYVVELPFFENVSIKESKKARYQKYSLISRSSNLYSYLGADSRTLNLSFNMTMPHVLENHPEISIDKYINYMSDKDNLEEEKEKFKKPYSGDANPKGMAFELGTHYTKSLASESARQLLNGDWAFTAILPSEKEKIIQRYGLNQSAPLPDSNLTNENPEVPELSAEDIASNQVDQLKYRIIDLLIYWTNIIRSSVVNYSKNPIFGPPIIRLRHGIMYQDIPCICTDYSIGYNEAAGYDLDTLLPRQLQITMKLEEIRTGDFGEFDTTDLIKKDNLAGWEAVVLGDTHSMDPGYGGIL